MHFKVYIRQLQRTSVFCSGYYNNYKGGYANGPLQKNFSISLKEKSIFRFDYITGILFAFFYIVLKVYLWKGIYGSGGEAVNGIVLNDMIVYSILASLTGGVTKTSVMNDLNDSVLSGSIASDLLLPIGLKKYLLIRSVTKNILGTIYTTAPSVLAAILFSAFIRKSVFSGYPVPVFSYHGNYDKLSL